MDVTLVIILHNRHQNITRLIKYYRDFKANIILADSSYQKFDLEVLPAHWQHIYTPDINYTQKIEFVLQQVSTRYTILCADDDFIIPSAINECMLFLSKNSEYASVQGHCICYRKNEVMAGDEVDFYPIYPKLEYSYQEIDGLTRLGHLLKNYKSFLYAVHRTVNLKEAYAGASKSIRNLYLNEYNASILPVIKGKYKELPLLYQVREYAEDSDDKTAININTIIKDDRFKKDLNTFVDHLIRKIREAIPDQNDEILKKELLEGLQKLARSIDEQNNQKPTFKKRVGKLVALIPFWGRKIIKASRKSELDNQIKQFVRTAEDSEELEKIRILLKKYS